MMSGCHTWGSFVNKSTLISLRATVKDLQAREKSLSKILGSLSLANRNGAAGVVLDHLISVLQLSKGRLGSARMLAQDAELELSKLMGED